MCCVSAGQLQGAGAVWSTPGDWRHGADSGEMCSPGREMKHAGNHTKVKIQSKVTSYSDFCVVECM